MQDNKTPFYVSAYSSFVQAFLCLVMIIISIFTKSEAYRKGITENELKKGEKESESDSQLEGKKNAENDDEISFSSIQN